MNSMIRIHRIILNKINITLFGPGTLSGEFGLYFLAIEKQGLLEYMHDESGS